MRASLTFSAAIALGIITGGTLAPLSRGVAADTPSADQIINSLTPPAIPPTANAPPIVTRGIRLGGQPPDGKPATDGIKPPVAVKPPEANLSVPFATRSAMISPAAAYVLDQLGAALSSPRLSEYKFRVEGHTDTVGMPEMNKVLSEQRAASVIEYLVARYGIDRGRLSGVGMGEDGLLVETGPQVPNAANRRVLVVNLGR
jgi:outer membrane protein OmpA-like peptidoglycan-associated protein